MRASDEGLHAYLRPSVLCDRSPPPSAAGDEEDVGAVDVHSLRTQVQALLAARLLDRRTIRELREAAGGSRDEHTQRPRSPAMETRTSRNPARGAPPHTAHRLTSHKRLGMTAAELVLSSPSSIGSSSSLSSSAWEGQGRQALESNLSTGGVRLKAPQMECEALRVKCGELEALNADMEAHLQNLTSLLQARAREIQTLKDNHALCFAVGRLPGHIPGCRSCAARDALIGDLRHELAHRPCKQDLERAQTLCDETEAARMSLARELDMCRKEVVQQMEEVVRLKEAAQPEQTSAGEAPFEAKRLQRWEQLSEHQSRNLMAQALLPEEHNNEVLIEQTLQDGQKAFVQVQTASEGGKIQGVAHRACVQAKCKVLLAQGQSLALRLHADLLELREDVKLLHLELEREIMFQTKSSQGKDVERYQQQLQEECERTLTLEKHAEALAADVKRLRQHLQTQGVEHVGETSRLQTHIQHLQHRLALLLSEKGLSDLSHRRANSSRDRSESHAGRPSLQQEGCDRWLLEAMAHSAQPRLKTRSSAVNVNRLVQGTGIDREPCGSRELLLFIRSLDDEFGACRPEDVYAEQRFSDLDK